MNLTKLPVFFTAGLLQEAVSDRKRVHDEYVKGLEAVVGISVFESVCDDTVKNYAYFPILVEEEYGLTRDELYKKLAEKDIHARKYFYPITADQACFKNKYSNIELDVARNIANKVLLLPIYEGLSDDDIYKRIIATIA